LDYAENLEKTTMHCQKVSCILHPQICRQYRYNLLKPKRAYLVRRKTSTKTMSYPDEKVQGKKSDYLL